jgi:DNA-binding NarL/FixJ family response regulator
MRSGLANMLNSDPAFRVVGEAGNAEETLKQFRMLRPDVLLLDVTMPGMDGIEALRQLRSEFPDAHVLMLSSSEAEEDILHSLQAGANGYVTKTARPGELTVAILAVSAGKKVIGPAVQRRLDEQASGAPLSQRELEVLGLLRKGMSNPDIGQLLNISTRTAKAHVAALLVKLDAADRAEAVARGFERGLLKI